VSSARTGHGQDCVGQPRRAERSTAKRVGITGINKQLTFGRVPCATFQAKMADPHRVKTFTTANRPGTYLRVAEPGYVKAGDLSRWWTARRTRLTPPPHGQVIYPLQSGACGPAKLRPHVVRDPPTRSMTYSANGSSLMGMSRV
jgi:MOSC domain